MIRSIIAICVIVVGAFVMYSINESPSTVVGEVFMEAGETAPYAEIKIYSAEDHKLVRAELADVNGNFSFSNLKTGDYTLEVSYVGFKDHKSPLAISSNKKTDAGSIDLETGFSNSEFTARPATAKLVKS